MIWAGPAQLDHFAGHLQFGLVPIPPLAPQERLFQVRSFFFDDAIQLHLELFFFQPTGSRAMGLDAAAADRPPRTGAFQAIDLRFQLGPPLRPILSVEFLKFCLGCFLKSWRWAAESMPCGFASPAEFVRPCEALPLLASANAVSSLSISAFRRRFFFRPATVPMPPSMSSSCLRNASLSMGGL